MSCIRAHSGLKNCDMAHGDGCVICDRIQICVVDLITAERTCFDAGNRSLLTSLTGNKIGENTNIDENQHVANVYIDDDHCITIFYGEYADYYGNHCVRNLGIKYFG